MSEHDKIFAAGADSTPRGEWTSHGVHDYLTAYLLSTPKRETADDLYEALKEADLYIWSMVQFGRLAENSQAGSVQQKIKAALIKAEGNQS